MYRFPAQRLHRLVVGADEMGLVAAIVVLAIAVVTVVPEETLRAIAEANGATVAQLAIAWVLSRGDDVVPLVGARTRERLAEALGAREVEFTGDDLVRIEEAVPVEAVAGERYHAEQMAILDSERD